jgi:hypothetical protein
MSMREITGSTLGIEESRFLFLAPGRRATDGIVNVRLDAGELTLERLHEPADAFLMRGLARFSRCLSDPIMSTIWRRRATRSASCWWLGRAAALV